MKIRKFDGGGFLGFTPIIGTVPTAIQPQSNTQQSSTKSSLMDDETFKELTKINQGLQIPISDRYLEQVENSFFYITNEFLKDGSKNKYFIKNPPESVLCKEEDILMTRTGNTGQVVTNITGAFHNNFFKIKYSKDLNKNFLV